MDIITKLPKTHPDSKIKTQLFKSQICDIELMNVWCCGDGEPADKLALESLKGKFLIRRCKIRTIVLYGIFNDVTYYIVMKFF